MVYCQPDQKPKVVYQFASSKTKEYQTDVSPIDVSSKVIEEVTFQGGQCLVNYHVVGEAVVEYRKYHEFRPENQRYTTQVIKHYYDTRINSSPIPGKILGIQPEFGYVGWQFGGSFNGLGLRVQNSIRKEFNEQGNTFYYFAFVVPWHRSEVLVPTPEPSFNYSDQSSNTVLSVKITQVIRADNQLDNCGSLVSKCRLEVLYQNNIIFYDQGDCPCNFKVQCGDCPDGYMKCPKDGYPGYCCVSCNEIKNEIKSLTNIVRGIVNG